MRSVIATEPSKVAEDKIADEIFPTQTPIQHRTTLCRRRQLAVLLREFAVLSGHVHRDDRARNLPDRIDVGLDVQPIEIG